MNIGAVLVGIALLVLVAAYVARPLFERQAGRSNGRTTNASPRVQLVARRDAVYALIRELDADYQTGKVNDEDYQAQRERYVAEGVSLLKRLDALAGEDSFDGSTLREHPEPVEGELAEVELCISTDSTPGRAALEAEIEAAVLTLRQAGAPTKQPASQPTRFCTQCGQPAAPEDNFCGQCGASLKRTA
jgi:hypothetical protein